MPLIVVSETLKCSVYRNGLTSLSQTLLMDDKSRNTSFPYSQVLRTNMMGMKIKNMEPS